MIRRLIVAGTLLAIVVAVVATARLFVFPRTHTPLQADAVVMFVGGRGERLDTALGLVEAGVAKNLVIPNGTVDTWPQANRLCRGKHSFTVTCPSPDTDTTRGEARAIAAVARRHNWDHVVLVTSTYHVTRARLLMSRCFDGKVDAVEARPGVTIARFFSRVTHEWAGLGEAVLVNNGC
ncbi:MAG: YdcF family protein [Actinobacteria bacterium]|nr:YdcF family protein [Actinomycetota bacterium]